MYVDKTDNWYTGQKKLHISRCSLAHCYSKTLTGTQRTAWKPIVWYYNGLNIIQNLYQMEHIRSLKLGKGAHNILKAVKEGNQKYSRIQGANKKRVFWWVGIFKMLS